MRVLEYIFLAITLTGIAFFIGGLSGGLAMTALGTALLAMLYFTLGFWLFNSIPLLRIFKKASYHEVTAVRAARSIISGFLLSEIVIAILFKLAVWKGGGVLVLLAGVAITGLFAMNAICCYVAPVLFNKRLLIRTVFYLAAYITVVLIPLDVFRAMHPVHMN